MEKEKSMKFACRPVRLDFVESAPLRFVNELEINASSEDVFKVLADADASPGFLADVIKAEWTSPEPHGVGSTRMLVLKSMTARENFIAWEPGKRFTFYISETTTPPGDRVVERFNAAMSNNDDKKEGGMNPRPFGSMLSSGDEMSCLSAMAMSRPRTTAFIRNRRSVTFFW